ncbi:MAG: NHLP leader peptide family RiPP precursor [Rivularia sp. (in: cyanobacteria)]
MLINNNHRINFEELLIVKATKDTSFKKELIENPKIAISKEFGTQLPAEIEIRILEETEKILYIVLPCTR